MSQNTKNNPTEDAPTGNASPTPAAKRKPPKLRQKPPAEAAADDSGTPGSTGTPQPEMNDNVGDEKGTKGDKAPADNQTNGDAPQDEAQQEAEDESPGDDDPREGTAEEDDEQPEDDEDDPPPESPPTEEIGSPEPEPEREPDPPKRHYRPRRTVTRERERNAPPEVWGRHDQDQSGQQLSRLADVGQTTDQVGELAQDVGGKAVGEVGNTAGKALGALGGQSGEEDKGKEEQLRLRLDLNLDIEVQLKAKIHGDLTLQLL